MLSKKVADRSHFGSNIESLSVCKLQKERNCLGAVLGRMGGGCNTSSIGKIVLFYGTNWRVGEGFVEFSGSNAPNFQSFWNSWWKLIKLDECE